MRNKHIKKEIAQFLPNTGFSNFLRTEKLMEAWYCLHNKNITVIVDSIRPRILRFYGHGKFGNFQNLLYDTNILKEISGFYGIVPFYKLRGKNVLPFINEAYWFEDFGGKKVRFDAKSNRIRMETINCYLESEYGGDRFQTRPDYDKEKNKRLPIDFGVKLNQDEIIIEVKYPEGIEKGMLGINLYPLYTYYYRDKGDIRPVEYFQYGFENTYFPHFDKVIGKNIVLEDEFCRMPKLTINSSSGRCRLISQTDKERNNAFRLNLIVETDKPEQEVRIKLDRNAITVKVNPLVEIDKNARIEIFGRDIISCKIDEKEQRTKRITAGKYEVQTSFSEGEHGIKVESNAGLCLRTVYGVDISHEKINKMSGAIMKMFWQNRDKKDLIAYISNLNTLKPVYRCGESYGSHGVRALTMLVLGTKLFNNKKYVDMAFKGLKTLVNKSHCFDNSALLLPIALDMNGKPACLNGCRPSDLCILVRAFLYTARVYGEVGEKNKRKECLDYAIRYAKTLFRMQREDGAFYSRYSYPDLKPTTEMVGTVNNWMIQIWNLIKVYKNYDIDMCKRLRQLLQKHIDFLIFKTKPSILKISGGADEGPANFHDEVATTSVILAMKYLFSNAKKYKKYAEEAFKMSFCYREHRIDCPQAYMYPCNPSLGKFYDQPGLPVKGGMTDLTGNEAGIFLKEYLNYNFGEYVACYCTAATLTDNYKSNGGLCGVTIQVPNYYYRRECSSETLNYGAMGVVLFWLMSREGVFLTDENSEIRWVKP